MLRESVASTCLQNGIAMPHARTTEVKQQTIAIGINKKGYEFESLDGKASKIFILCLSPEKNTGTHIECLADIGKILSEQQNIEKILNAAVSDEVYDIFRK